MLSASEQALVRLGEWTLKGNGHFERCRGEIHGDAPAWYDIYHDPQISNDLVYEWLQWMKVIELQHPKAVSQRARNIFNDAEVYMNKNWSKPRCFDKGIGRNRHQPLFKCFMEMRDIVNDINGYVPPKPKKPEPPLSPFDNLFTFD
jgi:hypothetical protein